MPGLDSSTASHPTRKLEMLAIYKQESDCTALRAIMMHTNWALHCVPDLQQALQFLEKHAVPVIVCPRDLGEDGWKDVIGAVAHFRSPPNVVVYTEHADDAFWMDVLHSGGYDILLKPFNRDEVFRLLSLAWRKWNDDVKQLNRLHHRKNA